MERKPHPVDASKISKFSLNLPDDCYFEYAFIDQTGQIKADPQNLVKADNPWYPNASALIGPKYQADTLLNPSLKAEGNVKRLRPTSAALNETRRIITYTPKGFENKALPVIYAQDGIAYYRIAQLPVILEHLIEDGFRPAHLVFVEPNDRTSEYRYNANYRKFMIEELLPLMEVELNCSAERILLGASLGALVSTTLALKHPDLFQTVLSQSGAFLGSPSEPDFYTGKSSWLLDNIKQEARNETRWYIDTGTIEWLYKINKEVAELLKEKNYELSYAERNAGHNWLNWRNGIANALRFALA